MILSDNDRKTFIAWLFLEIQTCQQLENQTTNLNLGEVVTTQLNKKLKLERVACQVVLQKLENYEVVKIG